MFRRQPVAENRKNRQAQFFPPIKLTSSRFDQGERT